MTDPRGVRASAAIFVAALVPRLYTAVAWARQPVWDGHYYDIGARSIAAGSGYAGTTGKPWCHYPVGYPGLLGLVYRLVGSHRLVGPLLNALLGALTAVIVFHLARTVVGSERPWRAWLAGGLVALSPGLVAYTPLVMTEPTSAALLAAAALVAARGGARTKGVVAAGLLLGLGTLVRPQTILCAPAVALFATRDATWRARLRVAALATAVSLAVVAPWTVRNCAVMDGCAFVSTNGGWNLAIGAFPRATGRFETLRGSDGCGDVRGQVEQDRCWSRAARRWIAADPMRWLGLMPKKLGHTFDHESFAVGYLAEADPDRWPEGRKTRARELLTLAHRALLSLVPLAFVARPSRKRPSSLLAPLAVALLVWIAATSDGHPFWPLALAATIFAVLRPGRAPHDPTLAFSAYALATLIVVHAVFFGEDRYHLVLTPLMCVMAASALRRPENRDDASSTTLPAAAADRLQPAEGAESAPEATARAG